MLQSMGSQRVRYGFIMQRRDRECTQGTFLVINGSRDGAMHFTCQGTLRIAENSQKLGDKCGIHSLSESTETNFENILISDF